MSIGEIADLFGIYYREAKRHIWAIEKSGNAQGDDSMDCVVEKRNIYPEYYGLEMISAFAFRVQSRNAQIFRDWLMKKAVASTTDISKMNILICKEWNNILLN